MTVTRRFFRKGFKRAIRLLDKTPDLCWS